MVEPVMFADDKVNVPVADMFVFICISSVDTYGIWLQVTWAM
jgi:uncharacterized membrane protein (DUF2068 family)